MNLERKFNMAMSVLSPDCDETIVVSTSALSMCMVSFQPEIKSNVMFWYNIDQKYAP